MSPPMYLLLARLIGLLIGLINIYVIVVIVAVVVSWLVAFGVLNIHNLWARRFVQILDSVTEPVFRRIRRIVPPLGGLDLSPLILFVILQVVIYVLDFVLEMAALHVAGS